MSEWNRVLWHHEVGRLAEADYERVIKECIHLSPYICWQIALEQAELNRAGSTAHFQGVLGIVPVDPAKDAQTIIMWVRIEDTISDPEYLEFWRNALAS